MQKTPRKPIHLRLPTALLDRVDAACQTRGQTRTALIERAIQSDLGHPEPPPVVKQYDENAKGRTR